MYAVNSIKSVHNWNKQDQIISINFDQQQLLIYDLSAILMLMGYHLRYNRDQLTPIFETIPSNPHGICKSSSIKWDIH
ncbi:hypothetical protein T05_439 [Trichinella murrelli]|uniref:Uncharacterized protein n=1 Tax=Trichinella murrelli TaxID=144512 RepID=A0A0V0TIK7_9BILA|nr:hypothetical protein T05_439 [Trichinella murrelli]